MNEYKCKGCLIDSTHGKLQKKKEALLEFIFAENSLCLTVSAQNVNIMAYTLSKDTISTVILNNELLVINFKAKKQIKISTIGKTKLYALKKIFDSLLNEDLTCKKNKKKKKIQLKNKIFFNLAYQISIENFRNNSNNTSKINQSINSNLLSDTTSKKQVKNDKMKVLENDENSQPTILNTSKTNEKKKNAFHR